MKRQPGCEVGVFDKAHFNGPCYCRPEVGDLVEKTGGDYTFKGIVVGVITKRRSGENRFVVEDDRGLLMIFNRRQIHEVSA